jgi:tetratricopeptide (TPR) repeat protein
MMLGTAGLGLVSGTAGAGDDGISLEPIRTAPEQTLGQGRTALWTLPLVATQYQPAQPAPVMQKALQAQEEGRFLNALILLDEAAKSGQAGGDARAELDLLRVSFLLQGSQSGQALEMLAPLLAQSRYAADANALSAMAWLQQGNTKEALKAAQLARNAGGGVLPHLAMSYALQSEGRLPEARAVVHDLNDRAPQAVTLAREAELALTLGQVQPAKVLVRQAQASDAAHPYVTAVSGLVLLIEERADEAKAAFEKALRRDPKDPKALLGLGLAEISLGRLQDGQNKLRLADEADPDNALILTYLGRAQQEAGQIAAATTTWRSARQADPKDPTPWLYQAQAELQSNRLPEAQESLRQAQARTAYRSVYRGEHLLKEDEQLLRANLAEVQRRQGLENLAFYTLSDPVGEKNSATLRNQADLLQGRRFGESARRSLLLQSLFNEKPGNLPSELDIYGDGAGQTGAMVPQHGVVSGLSAQNTSYHNYDALFGQRLMLEADGITGSQSTNGEQIRLGVGNDILGLGIAQRQYRSNGFAPIDYLDSNLWQATAQWRPSQSMQLFATHHAYRFRHGEARYPTVDWASNDSIEDRSWVTRLGLRHSLAENSELRALWSRQQTDQVQDVRQYILSSTYSLIGSSNTHSAELQYRHSGATHAMQLGVQQSRGRTMYVGGADDTRNTQQLYAAWQQALGTSWQLDARLDYGKAESQDNAGFGNNTSLSHWLPKLGVVWSPGAATHLRFAAWDGMGFYSVGDASLAPTSLAGILLSRYGDDGKMVHGIGFGGDVQLGDSWKLAVEARQHKTESPYTFTGAGQQYYVRNQVDDSWLSLQWQPGGKRWVVNLTLDYERIQNDQDPAYLAPDSVNEQNLHSQNLEVRWFASEKWMAKLAWSHNLVSGTQKGFDPFFSPILLPYRDGFNQVDVSMDWQLARSTSLTAGMRNAGDVRFNYMDIDRLNPRFSTGRVGYFKLKLVW